MKRLIVLIMVFTFIAIGLSAQNKQYPTHTMAKGETLSMLAQKYNTTVGDIMRLNGMNATSTLSEGQKIKIPPPGVAIERNAGAEEKKAVQEEKVISVPVSSKDVHIVQKGETLYGISKKYGLTLDQLKHWNNLTSDNLETGMPLAVNEKGIAVAAKGREEQQKTMQAANTVEQQKTAVTPPPSAADVPVVSKESVPVKKTITNVDPGGSDSYFSKAFNDSLNIAALKTMTGSAMTFKTASGWSDKKYYILMDEAASGSVVKIKAPNGNIVYAKVLWQIDDLKMNEGLRFRISEAAAAALGLEQETFGLTVQYHN